MYAFVVLLEERESWLSLLLHSLIKLHLVVPADWQVFTLQFPSLNGTLSILFRGSAPHLSQLNIHCQNVYESVRGNHIYHQQLLR